MQAIWTFSSFLIEMFFFRPIEESTKKKFSSSEVQLMIIVASIAIRNADRKTKHNKYRAVSFYKAIRKVFHKFMSSQS